MNELPSAGDESLSASALGRVDQRCDAFEDAWQSGQRPRVADFLAGVEEPERSRLLRELLSLLAHYLREEQRRRWQQGERVSVREYLHEMPELHEEPDLVFELIRDEVLLREEYKDTPPRPEDYLDLLPSHEVQLRAFFTDRQATPLRGGGQPEEPAAPPLDRYQVGGFIGRGGMGMCSGSTTRTWAATWPSRCFARTAVSRT